jgi:hypothetical protein
MSRDKQIEEKSKRRKDYLKFKPFADDLRQAESWCELDGVLNRYQTVKNLSKMGYRKASEVAEEIFEEIDKEIELALDSNYKVKRDAEDMNYGLVNYVEGKIHCLRGLLDFLAELKKKYTESEKDK